MRNVARCPPNRPRGISRAFLGLAFVAWVAAAVSADAPPGRGPCAFNEGEGREDLYGSHPSLCAMLDRLEEDPESVASELASFARAHGRLVGETIGDPGAPLSEHERDPAQLPVVFAHGMGDSCFNDGMVRIGEHTAGLLGGVYVTCVPTGDTKTEDTTNGYFLNMDASVDAFAARIAADPELRGGFHAVGFSQGNNVIRGYVARYNTPTVHTFLSVNGVNAGEGTVPGCFPSGGAAAATLGSVCDLLLEQASRRAYTEFAQKHSFQSNYWRDPRASEREAYQKFSQLARWNNEGPEHHNATLNENFARTSRFVWVRATKDSMVWPSEGEHWGSPDPDDPFGKPVLPMNETEWYTEDLFGLRTAQEAGKNVFETFEGDHLRFSMEDFDRWVRTYLVGGGDAERASADAIAEAATAATE